jgi:hypothetical protein
MAERQYIEGLERTPGAETRFVSHLYAGTFSDPGLPMCWRGWNRYGGTAYSIWRGNRGRRRCRVCARRAKAGLPGVPARKTPRALRRWE